MLTRATAIDPNTRDHLVARFHTKTTGTCETDAPIIISNLLTSGTSEACISHMNSLCLAMYEDTIPETPFDRDLAEVLVRLIACDDLETSRAAISVVTNCYSAHGSQTLVTELTRCRIVEYLKSACQRFGNAIYGPVLGCITRIAGSSSSNGSMVIEHMTYDALQIVIMGAYHLDKYRKSCGNFILMISDRITSPEEADLWYAALVNIAPVARAHAIVGLSRIVNLVPDFRTKACGHFVPEFCQNLLRSLRPSEVQAALVVLSYCDAELTDHIISLAFSGDDTIMAAGLWFIGRYVSRHPAVLPNIDRIGILSLIREALEGGSTFKVRTEAVYFTCRAADAVSPEMLAPLFPLLTMIGDLLGTSAEWRVISRILGTLARLIPVLPSSVFDCIFTDDLIQRVYDLIDDTDPRITQRAVWLLELLERKDK